MKDKICVYCGNNEGGCVADVPYYCVSIRCGYFVEKDEEPVAKKKREYSPKTQMRRLMKRTLVETL
jgi:hypothetical protein